MNKHSSYTKKDNWTTHIDYLKVIEPYISKELVINDPFYFNGYVKELWTQLGRDIIHEDKDFFTNTHIGDIFVSNPPFSIINKILVHLFSLEKPFILLIPIQKICMIKTQKILKAQTNIQVIISPIYQGFINDEGIETKCPSQYYCYLCWNVKLPNDLVFADSLYDTISGVKPKTSKWENRKKL